VYGGVRRIDFERIECPECKERFVRMPEKVRERWCWQKRAQPGQDWASFLRWLAKCVYFGWHSCTPAGPGRQHYFLSSRRNLVLGIVAECLSRY
jgi:hypothetical protein